MTTATKTGRVYCEARYGHGVAARYAMGAPYRWIVFYEDGEHHEDIASFASESHAWSLCERLRTAFRRGRYVRPGSH